MVLVRVLPFYGNLHPSMVALCCPPNGDGTRIPFNCFSWAGKLMDGAAYNTDRAIFPPLLKTTQELTWYDSVGQHVFGQRVHRADIFYSLRPPTSLACN
jgi:hypothetical protein